MVWQTGKAEKKRYACHALRKDITPTAGASYRQWNRGSTEGERGEVTGKGAGAVRERERERERDAIEHPFIIHCAGK